MSSKQIISKLPGIFYRKPNPEEPAYKNNGDSVTENDTIGLIEVMKSFHEVRADISGKIVRFYIENETQIMPGDLIAEIE